MFRLFGISVEVPALDRLLDYLEGKKQAEIDSLSAQVNALTLRLQTHRTGLESAIEKEN